MLEDDTGICDAFERAIAQVVGASSLAKEVTEVLVSDPATIAPIKTYVVKMANKAFSQALKPEARSSPPSSPTFESDNPLSEIRTTAARRVERFRGKPVTVASHHVRLQL